MRCDEFLRDTIDEQRLPAGRVDEVIGGDVMAGVAFGMRCHVVLDRVLHGRATDLAPGTSFAGTGWGLKWLAGFLMKLCRDSTPAIAGARAAGTCGSVAFAQCCSPLTRYL